MLKSVVPRTQLDSYSPGQEVNFDLFSDGEALVPGTVMLTGRLYCAGTTGAIYIDPLAGIASVFENVIVRAQNGWQEIITNYGRFVKMSNALQYSPDSLCAGLKASCELLAPHIAVEQSMLVDATNTQVGIGNGMPFAHRWANSLNNMTGNLSFAKAGRIQLSFKLPPVSKVFFGADVGAAPPAPALGYTLRDLELHYMTSTQAADTVTVNTVEDTQKNIVSSDTTVQNTFINQVSKLLVSFADIECETDQTQNALACQHPRIERLSWMYNDVSNQLVSYEIETVEEQVLSALNIYPVRGVGLDIREFQSAIVQNGQTLTQDKFMVGLNLGSLMNFTQSPVGLNVRMTSDANFRPTYAYFYGFGQQTVQ
jgi:hypothetical protein